MDTRTWLCGSPPRNGQRQRYPGRFLHNLQLYYPTKGLQVLSMFAGESGLGTTTDLREKTGADIICQFDKIPLPDGSFDMVIADPPYNIGYGLEWTKQRSKIPRPKHVLREASRLTRPGGLVLILHTLVIPAYKEFGVKRLALHPVLCGPNNAVRVLNVFRKCKNA